MFIMRLIGRMFHKPVTINTRFPDYRRYRCANHRTHDGTEGCGFEFEHLQRDEWCGPYVGIDVTRPMVRTYAAMLNDYRECFDNFVDIGPATVTPKTITRVRSGRR